MAVRLTTTAWAPVGTIWAFGPATPVTWTVTLPPAPRVFPVHSSGVLDARVSQTRKGDSAVYAPDGTYVYRSAALTPLVPMLVCTVTSTAPAVPAGVYAVIK